MEEKNKEAITNNDVEVPEPCAYLEKFAGNISQAQLITQHVCSNFKERYESFKGRDQSERKAYCIFHCPNSAKANEFKDAVWEKLNRGYYYFFGAWFPEAFDFSRIRFSTPANFEYCIFNDSVIFDNATFEAGADFTKMHCMENASFNYTNFVDVTETIGLETRFYSVEFEGEANFISTKFRNPTTFSEAKFYNGCSFNQAVFKNDISFEKSTFTSAYFNEAIFEKNANFRGSEFSTISFHQAAFRRVADFRDTIVKSSLGFQDATFEGFAKFSGKERNHNSWKMDALDFSFVDTEKSEQIRFHTLNLKPQSFLNTDVRKFEFTDIKWKMKYFGFDFSRLKDFLFWTEKAKRRKSEYELLSIVYRRLAANAEENNRYLEASKFRFRASELDRIGSHWYGRLTFLSWLYKWSSRFGENYLWAIGVLVLLLATFAFYYHYAFFQICPKESNVNIPCATRTMDWKEATHQSFMTAALQNVEYRKTMTTEQDLLILLQKVLSPIQAALLLLAIRRKFMR